MQLFTLHIYSYTHEKNLLTKKLFNLSTPLKINKHETTLRAPSNDFGSYYTCMIHTFTRLTLISLILPNSQNAFYKVCTYTANSYKKRWPNHQYNIRPFKRVLKNKIYLHYNKQILLPSLITIY